MTRNRLIKAIVMETLKEFPTGDGDAFVELLGVLLASPDDELVAAWRDIVENKGLMYER